MQKKSIKQIMCEQYREYLEIIYFFGNKVILQKQLYQYAKKLSLVNNISAFYKVIKKLEDNKILKIEQFIGFGRKTQLGVIKLRKYGIRFIEGKDKSYNVASLPKTIGNERVMISIYKNCYIINKVIPRIETSNEEISIKNIIKILMKDNSTILSNKNQGTSIMYKLLEDIKINNFLNKEEFLYDLERLNTTKRVVEEGLKRNKNRLNEDKYSIIKTNLNISQFQFELRNKDINSASKYERIEKYTFNTMLSFNAYVAQIKCKEKCISITVLVFDIYNRTNVYKFIEHIACIYNMFERYFGEYIRLKVGIVSIDSFNSKRLEEQSKSISYSSYNNELNSIRLSKILKQWNVSELDQDKIDVIFTNYNIVNEYLEGIKFANLFKK